MVLRLESSGAQPAMISSSYTSESQARHREQLDSRICRQRLGKHVVRPGLLPRLPPQGPGAVGVCPQSAREGRSSLPGKVAGRTQGCH